MDKKKLYALFLVAAITVAVLVPVLILMGRGGGEPLAISILTPTNSTYTSQTTQITVDLDAQGDDLDTVWYRIYNETDGAWVDPANVTWTTSMARTLGQGGVYTLYAWVNSTTGTTLADNVMFTMIHEIVIDGGYAFPSDWTCGEYEKYILRHGAFSHSSGSFIYVDGILEIDNVTWSTTLRISANSEVTITDSSFASTMYFYNDVVAVLDNVTHSSILRLYDNASLTITDASLSTIELYGESNLNVSYTAGGIINANDESEAVIINYTMTSPTMDINLADDSKVTVVNSSLDDFFLDPYIYSGTWTINQNVLSGTGSVDWQNLTVINCDYARIDSQLRILGTGTQVLVKNAAQFSTIGSTGGSNMTLINTTANTVTVEDDSNATLLDSSMASLDLSTNGTCYLEDVTITFRFLKYYRFYQGNITGYNDSYVGAESWAFTKYTIGPGVSINRMWYGYWVYNQVNLTVTNTSIYSILTFNDANVSVYYCPTIDSASLYSNSDLTLYYSNITTSVWCQTNSNLTFYASSCNYIWLYGSAFAAIHAGSYVIYLSVGTGGYVITDSTVVNIV